MVKNGDFTFLLLELILADQMADLLPPKVLVASGQEWQFHICTVRAHIGRSSGRSTPTVLASSGQEWQFHISTVRAHIGRSTGRSTPQYRYLVVKNGNSTFVLLEPILADQLADQPPSTAI